MLHGKLNSPCLRRLDNITQDQSHATEHKDVRMKQLLVYCATHTHARVRYDAYDMTLKIYMDAVYLSEQRENPGL